ncbi:hypothetical protein PhaeoP97_01855 [Phaeobacter porticola]|uniref:Uncharacterized protein n=1 Tax=Phaeobacter porticola TaxID=1844006 RepID=A0A1L3I591_9RHOB|nr:hypothetical protein PhaeoP97_01855 [Phaeobacter porticola]
MPMDFKRRSCVATPVSALRQAKSAGDRMLPPDQGRAPPSRPDDAVMRTDPQDKVIVQYTGRVGWTRIYPNSAPFQPQCRRQSWLMKR